MARKIPVCLDIDDHTPFVHVYRYHRDDHRTDDGRELKRDIERDFLDDFCDTAERHGVRGKLTIVPMPGGDRGDIVRGITGHTDAELRDWLDTVNTRLVPRFDTSPEMLTHNKTLNVLNGKFENEREVHWASRQTRGTFTPYIARSLRLIRDAGIMPTGVSSPWGFGREAEEEYRAAIATAMKEELGLDRGWYFSVRSGPNPDISEPIKGFRLAAVKHNVGDMVWQGINSPRDDVEFINKIADDYITEDGKSGKAAERILSGEPAIMLIHWQSLYSNGTRSGLRAFENIAERINRCYGDIAEWMTFSEFANL